MSGTPGGFAKLVSFVGNAPVVGAETSVCVLVFVDANAGVQDGELIALIAFETCG